MEPAETPSKPINPLEINPETETPENINEVVPKKSVIDQGLEIDSNLGKAYDLLESTTSNYVPTKAFTPENKEKIVQLSNNNSFTKYFNFSAFSGINPKDYFTSFYTYFSSVTEKTKFAERFIKNAVVQPGSQDFLDFQFTQILISNPEFIKKSVDILNKFLGTKPSDVETRYEFPKDFQANYEIAFNKYMNTNVEVFPKNFHEIYESAFNKYLKSKLEHFPKEFHEIYEIAFNYCIRLDLKNLPKDLVEIYKSTSNNSTALQFPEEFRKHYEIAFNKYMDSKLESFPNNFKEIYEYAFNKRMDTRVGEFPNDVHNSYNLALSKFFEAKFDKLPSNLPEINELAFIKCLKTKFGEFSNELFDLYQLGFRKYQEAGIEGHPPGQNVYTKIAMLIVICNQCSKEDFLRFTEQLSNTMNYLNAHQEIEVPSIINLDLNYFNQAFTNIEGIYKRTL
jgi:hypothetical protein